MPKFGDYSPYTLGDLAKAIKLPWRKFARWADSRLPEPIEGIVNETLSGFVHGYHSPCNGVLSAKNYSTWRDLAIDVVRQALYGCLGRKRCWEFVKLATGVDFEKTHRVHEWYRRLREKRKNLGWAMKELIAWRLGKRELDKRLRGAFGGDSADSGDWRWLDDNLRAVRWARWALRTPRSHERAFWVTVKEHIKEEVPDFLAIRNAINESRPITDDQLLKLARYQEHGRIQIIMRLQPEGSIRVENIMKPRWTLPEVEEPHRRSCALLAPLAHRLAADLAGSQPWPRFVATCRNPFCGELFYSGRKGAVACPRKPGTGRRSKCKPAWDAYRKWLLKFGVDPEQAWHDKKLQAQFKAQHKPRGSQSGML